MAKMWGLLRVVCLTESVGTVSTGTEIEGERKRERAEEERVKTRKR